MTADRRQTSPIRRGLAWSFAALFLIVSVVVAVLFGILSQSIARDLMLSQAQLGTLSGVFFISYSVGQLVLGAVLGSRSTRLILASTAIVSAAGCLLFSLSTTMGLALAGRILSGVGFSCSFVGVIYIITRDYPQRFSFMAALSQSLANMAAASIALVASATPNFAEFRGPLMVVGVLLVPIAGALWLFTGGERLPDDKTATTEPTPSLAATLRICGGCLQFWVGLVYYSCLFGTFLAYADLWNIQFQMEFFHHSPERSALLNAMIPLGVTVGSLVAGSWAQAGGDFVWPARVFGGLAVIIFAVMFLLQLPEAMAMAANVVIGFALSGSILGLTALEKHLPLAAQTMGTAIVVTAAYVAGGVIQPVVGWLVEAPATARLLHIVAVSDNLDFLSYQRGFAVLLGVVLVGFLASLLFRSQPRKG